MPQHVVVDGSNLATEGRSQPSLHQLNDAVMAYIADHPDALITVVVDATFGHRIDSSETAEFDDAVSNNELVAPPAGAIGRGDAFVLSIAHKVKATILSNDSFQEFHAEYPWLFDEGRLVGGKPVPHIGWVFVNRSPVRGPLSRKVTAEAKRRGGRGSKADDQGTVRVGSADANRPMPVPKAPPPGPARGRKPAAEEAAPSPEKAAPKSSRRGAKAAPAREPVTAAAPSPAIHTVKHVGVNDLLPFLTFVERHPVGTMVEAVVDHYSSHGAYVRVGEVLCYVPLRLMADPAPRSAREFMKVGDTVQLVVHSLVAGRRSIDLATTAMAPELVAPAPAKPARRTKAAAAAPAIAESIADAAPSKKATGKKATGKATTASTTASTTAEPAKKTTTKKTTAKKTLEPAKKAAAAKPPATKAPSKTAAEAVATPAPTKARATKTATATKAAAAPKAATATKAAQPVKKTPPKKTTEPVKKAAAAKSSAKRAAAPAKKAAAKKATR
jgi:hypothetical protein